MNNRGARSLLLVVVISGPAAHAQDPTPAAPQGSLDLTNLSLEELANVEVVSVQKRPSPLKNTPAAVSVVTGDEIEASGATSVPSLLRRAPGVHVAKLDASQWAIGIRGFTNGVARAQLALMDGRSLYTPLFAGTYWDVQNVFLEDVDRIEIVRGPGGTLWGANAVNGVVNIITKGAEETQGGLVVVGAGDQERGFGRARYGGRFGNEASYRVHAMYFDRAPESRDGYDGWHLFQGGFRTDWTPNPSDKLSFQSDVYQGRAGRRTTFATFSTPFVETVERDAELSGGYLRASWNRSFSDGRALTVQAYYDRTNRVEPQYSEKRDTLDVDAQYRFELSDRHVLVAGLGYRVSDGRTTSVPTLAFVPPDKTDDLFSAFVEDTIRLVPERLVLAVGTKVERNDYSDFDLQPSARLMFNATSAHAFWIGLTRAVRTPTRFDRDLVLDVAINPGTPAFVRILGDAGFETERSLVYEAGYRGQLSRHISIDVASFYNRYPNLPSYEVGVPFAEPGRLIIPLRTSNRTDGKVGGIELGADMRPSGRWLVRASYAFLNMQITPQLSSNDMGSGAIEDQSPRHQLGVSSMTSLPRDVSVSAFYRWVARLPSQNVSAYSEVDVRLAWRALDRLELALAGQNLLHARHVEFGPGTIGGSATGGPQVGRSLYGQATLRW